MNTTHFNTKIEKYLVSFEDGSTDYLKEEEIDNIEVILLSESKVSGRVRKAVNYKKLANM